MFREEWNKDCLVPERQYFTAVNLFEPPGPGRKVWPRQKSESHAVEAIFD